jgi:photosystem II stability/assembly factor-like uncharacterized protein
MGGKILRTTDSGQTWNEIASGVTNNLYAVKFATATIMYAVGAGTILTSRDAGITWSVATTDSFTEDLDGLSVQGTKSWATGQNGLILYSFAN